MADGEGMLSTPWIGCDETVDSMILFLPTGPRQLLFGGVLDPPRTVVLLRVVGPAPLGPRRQLLFGGVLDP